MYRDFEDLRDNCPAEIRADIALDFLHDDADRLAALWPATADGGFRLSLVQAVTGFWEEAVRGEGSRRGSEVPDDGFAIEIVVDSYADPEMGHSLYLELHAYCGTEGIGGLCRSVFEDERQEDRFVDRVAETAVRLMGEQTDAAGLSCEGEITKVS